MFIVSCITEWIHRLFMKQYFVTIDLCIASNFQSNTIIIFISGVHVLLYNAICCIAIFYEIYDIAKQLKEIIS